MKKENIKKYVGAGILSAAIIAGAGLGIVEAKTDHTHEWCPLNSIFGIQHQIDKINKQDGYFAQAMEIIYKDAKRILDDKGNVVGYCVDQGTLEGSMNKIVVVSSKANENTSGIIVQDSTGERVLSK